ncbi:hypothetical protein GVX81_01180 [[Haemophilus] felis]|uniref:LPS-assembly lipoprotein LptE n=1 Tax=[Haemophilus] felis TaxID=123822 RepID=A0A1T0AZW0_9PAST|nr:hypothetical protein [[Haemophilus] felis]NBI40116.1 hypothetical protein [[Haemophilus] felis]NBI42695.1 hypothetical protein [[Haemophilus] felis]OOS03490.1 hypothetical protein B0188_06500 [[Haemophilus] felis]
MLKQLQLLIFTSTILILSACGFRLNHGGLIPQELQTLSLQSNDPYDEMSITLRKQLQLNNVNLVERKQDVATLRLNHSRQKEHVASISRQGKEAEKILVLEVEATVSLPNQQPQSIETKVNRTFFDNPRAALAKSAEKEVIWNDMRQQAARQIIAKMVSLQPQTKK